jgi:hypothetical protein
MAKTGAARSHADISTYEIIEKDERVIRDRWLSAAATRHSTSTGIGV